MNSISQKNLFETADMPFGKTIGKTKQKQRV
jgi:hypothetical protein